MTTNVIMPALGMAQESGKVLRWLKREGDHVTQGEPLLEIETDKATVELEAPATGVLAQVAVREGESVPIGHVLALILTPSAPVATGRPRASPKARRLAKARGVDLAALSGSGPGGAILADDVAAVAARAPDAAPAPSPVAAPPSPAAVPPSPPSAPQVPTSTPQATTPGTVWRLMAERTRQTWTTVPHFFLFREVQAERLIAWREKYQKRARTPITYTDLLVRITAAVLRTHPHLNARWVDGKIVFDDAINISLAVATEDGLIVPVVHNADRLTLDEIARRRVDLIARARDGRLRPDDLSGGTFTISNLGMHGIDAFTAVLNAPQAAILAVGRIAERVVPVDGQPAVRPALVLSLSCDHRVVDGARGARFLESLSDLIEEPASLVE